MGGNIHRLIRNADTNSAPNHPHKFFDKAAVVKDEESNTNNRWRQCTVTQVEELKSFLRVLPVWASTIALSISFAQMSTFFITQALFMDRRMGPHLVPVLRRRTGHRYGVTSLQRMGVGLFMSVFAMVSAAVVERKRRTDSDPKSLSVFCLFPQFFLIGTAVVFTYVGQLEFFYDEATDGTRSISSALFLSEIGIGNWLSTAIVKAVEAATGSAEKGWLQNNLNKGRLDYFYWILLAFSTVNFLVYLVVAASYKGRSGGGATVGDESVFIGRIDGGKDDVKGDKGDLQRGMF